MVELVGRAYANISLGKLAALLGCGEAEAAQGERAGAGASAAAAAAVSSCRGRVLQVLAVSCLNL